MQITWVKKTESATRNNAVKPNFPVIYVHIYIYDVFPVSFSFSVTHIRTRHTHTNKYTHKCMYIVDLLFFCIVYEIYLRAYLYDMNEIIKTFLNLLNGRNIELSAAIVLAWRLLSVLFIVENHNS